MASKKIFSISFKICEKAYFPNFFLWLKILKPCWFTREPSLPSNSANKSECFSGEDCKQFSCSELHDDQVF